MRDELWCGARKGRIEIGAVMSETREWSLVSLKISLSVGGGRRFGIVLASMLLPAPGGPKRRILWWPAMATMRARLACAWPAIWSRNGPFESVSVFFTTFDVRR